MLKLLTDDNAHGKRLDQWLAQQLALQSSRCCLQSLIREGQVIVNGKTILEPRFKLSKNLGVIVNMMTAAECEPAGENIPLDILYEDKDLIVLDKPAGLVVHPGNGNQAGTLVNALVHHCGEDLSSIGGAKRPGIVHRLDKDTTGIMVVAKNDSAHHNLSQQFADHGRSGVLLRTYVALVWGAPNHKRGKIDLPLIRSHRDRKRQTVARESCSNARQAITHYTLLKKFGDDKNRTTIASLLECRLETGRTHQIRTHMAYLGHPLIGDMNYGSAFKTKANRLSRPTRAVVSAFPRQALHAQRLTFRHPFTGKIMTFIRNPPDDMQNLIESFQEPIL
ncbi:MAG: 23S rRNA pseudouridine synthase [Candidatus Tokpelaia sp. JSC085]|nr:MAG: 23S rRNA pseudouridine synthase [Candidatus Tokpelaia sp. JSC085]